MSDRATIREVASLAQVSIKTVSRVVNGEPGVSDATAARVRAAVASLHYQPDHAAGSLRRRDRRTRAIGLVSCSVLNRFDASIQRAAEEVAQRHGTALLAACSDEDPARERRIAAAFLARRVDGLLLMPTGPDQSFLAPELERGTPMVAVDRAARGIDVDVVTAQNEVGGRAGMAHLLSHGHRRIGVLGHLGRLPTASDRLRGARAAARTAGVELDERLIIQDLAGEDEARAAVMAAMAAPPGAPAAPTAWLATRNVLSSGAFRALRELGLLGSVALLGFDDFDGADLLDPALTVVAQDAYAMGSLAAERLFARLGGEQSEARHTVIPTRLIIRESCGCRRA